MVEMMEDPALEAILKIPEDQGLVEMLEDQVLTLVEIVEIQEDLVLVALGVTMEIQEGHHLVLK